MSPTQVRIARGGGGTENPRTFGEINIFRTDRGACLPLARGARPCASYVAGPWKWSGLTMCVCPG
jgi:hypothetical protein